MESSDEAALMELRRQRLRALLKAFKTQKQFAAAAGWASTAYVSLVLNGHKNIGDALVRRTVRRLGLAPDYFDSTDEPIAVKSFWPFSVSLESIQRLKPEDLRIIDAGMRAQVEAFGERDEAERRKKPAAGRPVLKVIRGTKG